MSGELGLRNVFKEKIVIPLQQYRGHDGTPGREISLIKYMQKLARNNEGGLGWTNAAGEPISWADIWCDLGMDPAFTTLDNLLSLSGTGLEYLAPEMIRDFIYEGFSSSADHMDLCARSENVSSMTITSPSIKFKDAEMQNIGEAETIPESAIEWSRKTVQIGKQAQSIKLTDELVLSATIPIVAPWLRRVGELLAAKLYRNAVTTLINGDQADGSDACTVIGVETQNTLAFEDFVRAWVRARRLNYDWSSLITSEEKANKVLGIPEFKNPQGLGGRVVEIESRNRVIPSRMPHFISESISNSQVMLIDKTKCMIFVVFRPLLVESERIIMRQINGTAASIICGFLTIDRYGRIIIDDSLLFSSHGFPATMLPLA